MNSNALGKSCLFFCMLVLWYTGLMAGDLGHFIQARIDPSTGALLAHDTWRSGAGQRARHKQRPLSDAKTTYVAGAQGEPVVVHSGWCVHVVVRVPKDRAGSHTVKEYISRPHARGGTELTTRQAPVQSYYGVLFDTPTPEELAKGEIAFWQDNTKVDYVPLGPGKGYTGVVSKPPIEDRFSRIRIPLADVMTVDHCGDKLRKEREAELQAFFTAKYPPAPIETPAKACEKQRGNGIKSLKVVLSGLLKRY